MKEMFGKAFGCVAGFGVLQDFVSKIFEKEESSD